MSDVEQAKSLLDLVTTPSVLVTGTFLAFTTRAIRENIAKVDRTRMLFALGASIAAIGVSGALTILMVPLAFRSLAINRGPIQPELLVYFTITLSVIGTLIYSAWVAGQCVIQLKRPAT
jgi:ABC-type transport system involved in Fe-S cluster assembly fused permease/ATPase subunit